MTASWFIAASVYGWSSPTTRRSLPSVSRWSLAGINTGEAAHGVHRIRMVLAQHAAHRFFVRNFSAFCGEVGRESSGDRIDAGEIAQPELDRRTHHAVAEGGDSPAP